MKKTRFLLALFFVLPAAIMLSQDQVYRTGGDVTAPVIIENVQPSYTPEAREAKIQGNIQLSAIVTADGGVQDVEVVKGLGYGLDENAVSALSKWRFKPGTKDGKPVKVKIGVTINFSLR
jgi:protein TonB